MGLNKKQVEFTSDMAYFQVWCIENGHQIIEGESHRPKVLAALYALPKNSKVRKKIYDLLGVHLDSNRKKGIKYSTHVSKLGRDFFIYKNGTVSWGAEDYRPLGEKWKSMRPGNCWGGDFKSRDAVHFSKEHNGVQ